VASVMDSAAMPTSSTRWSTARHATAVALPLQRLPSTNPTATCRAPTIQLNDVVDRVIHPVPTVAFLETCSVLWPLTRQSFRCVHLSPLLEGRTHFTLLRTALCSAESLLGILLCKGNVLLCSTRRYHALLCRDKTPRRRRSSCSPACESSLCLSALELVLSRADLNAGLG
jgi:hypothetical protein